jgi:opacity protein-like surface antigen
LVVVAEATPTDIIFRQMLFSGAKIRPWAAILIILANLSGASQPALAGGKNGFFTGPNKTFNMLTCLYGTLGFSLLAYYMYKHSPAQRAKGYPEELGPGEWYVAGYMGLSYLPPTDWKFTQNNTSNLLGPVAKGIHYQLGPVGGIKFGRYLDRYPWLGIEFETRFARNVIRANQGLISPPQPGFPPYLLKGSDWFDTWALQSNLLVRHGFLKDKEVTFGRLQPYIGIGPGFEIEYGRYDSAKNFAIEALAGIKYMVTKKIGLFFEYKFSYQFAIEYQNVPSINKSGQDLTYTFDLPHHLFVVGVAYHFKNLYAD